MGRHRNNLECAVVGHIFVESGSLGVGAMCRTVTTSMKLGCFNLRRNERRQPRTRGRIEWLVPDGHNPKDPDSTAPDAI